LCVCIPHPAIKLSEGLIVIVGSQWGDEGKGKLVDVLCDDVDIVARCQVCILAGRQSTDCREDIMLDIRLLWGM